MKPPSPSHDGGSTDGASSRRSTLVPAWLRGYDRESLRADGAAGLTLAAYLLPAAIGDASLAGLPPESGLYACICSGLVFGWLCSSRLTVISVTSSISLLMGTTLAALAGGDASRFVGLATWTALLVAGLAFLSWGLRAGALVNFVSESVLLGFKAGVALTLASTQLPKLCGFGGSHGGFWVSARHFLEHVGEANRAALAIGAGALFLLVLGKRLTPHKPVALFVVVAGIALATVTGLEARGVKLLGDVPQGLPALGLPPIDLPVNDLLPLALACFLLGAVETAAIGRTLASKNGARLDANRELLALAGSNLAAALGRGLPVSGGMSQSLVNESAGARTPASGLVAAALLALVALCCSGLLRALPQPVLAAIVLMAVVGLVNLRTWAHLWKMDRLELAIALAAFLGVLTTGLLQGVLIGAVISLLLLIHRAAHPHVGFLGRIPGTERFSDLARHPDNQPVPGVAIFRPEGSLIYFNADHVRETVLERVRQAAPPVHTVVCDLSSSPTIDLTSAEMLFALDEELRGLGAQMRFVEARGSVRERLRAQGIEALSGHVDRTISLADAVRAALEGASRSVHPDAEH